MQQKNGFVLRGFEAAAAYVIRPFRFGSFGACGKMIRRRAGTSGAAWLVFAVIALAAPFAAFAQPQSITATYRGTTITFDVSGLGELTSAPCEACVLFGQCEEFTQCFRSNGKGMFRTGGDVIVTTGVGATDGNLITNTIYDPTTGLYIFETTPNVQSIFERFGVGATYYQGNAKPGDVFTLSGKYRSASELFYAKVDISRWDPDKGNQFYAFQVIIFIDENFWNSLPLYDMGDPEHKGGPADNPDTAFIPPRSCPKKGFPTYTVNTATLNLVVQDTEFSVQSLGPSLVTTRTWNTDPSQAGIFGNGWSFAYASTLQKSCGGARVVFGSGKGAVYTADLCPTSGSLIYPVAAVAPEGIFDQLTYLSGDYWLLRKKDSRETYWYDPVTAGGDRYRLTSISDKNGNALAILYNTDGTISSVQDAASRQLSFIYDSSKRAVAMGTPDGRQAIFGYDAQGNLVRSVDLFGTEILYQYDADNYMSAMSYAGKMIRYTYDSSGGWKHVATVTDANGAVMSYSGTTGSSKTTITDARGGTTATTNNSGKTTSFLDALGNQTSMTFANGLLADKTDPKNNTVAMEYDARGNMTKMTDASGKLTTYAYDASDNLISRTNPLNETWTYGYDGRNNLTSVTSPGNNVSTLTYDAKGQMTGITDANGKITTFTYDSFGNRQTETDPHGKTTTFAYDSSGINRTSALDPNGNASTFAYDQNRRLTRITNADGTYRDFSYDGCAMTGVTDENGHSTSFSRDPMLRVTGTTDAMNSLTTNSYDGNGNLVTTTSPLQMIISMIFDAADRLATVTDPVGGSVQFARDGNGNVTAIRDERLKQTAFTFDANDRKLSTTDPLGRVVSVTRDDLGRLKQQKNGRGSLIGTTYDNDGRLTAKTYDAATAATYAYDKAGNLTSFTDAGTTTTYTYNGRNEVTGIVYPDGNAVAFAYDAAGNMVTTNYPGGPALTYGISNRNRIQSMQWDTSSVTLSHDAAGNLLSETRSNGTSSEYVYDANNRVTSIHHKKGAITIAAMDYIRNAAGNIVTENVTLPATISLTNGSEAGVYDNGNQISSFGGSAYSYDADGNLTGISGSRTFTGVYDPENRPVLMTSGGVTASYTYDALGNRINAVRGTQATRYYHDHRGRLLFEADGNGAIVNYYLYRGGRLVAMRCATGGSSFYHYDKTGNTVAVTDNSGSTVNAYAYTPYGEIAGSMETVANRFTYVGAYGVMDEGSGIYFMKNRYYDVVTGRFIHRDPFGFVGGINLYAYVGQNPVNRVDPLGLSAQKVPIQFFDNTPGAESRGQLPMPLRGTEEEADIIRKRKMSDKQLALLRDAWKKAHAAKEREDERKTKEGAKSVRMIARIPNTGMGCFELPGPSDFDFLDPGEKVPDGWFLWPPYGSYPPDEAPKEDRSALPDDNGREWWIPPEIEIGNRP